MFVVQMYSDIWRAAHPSQIYALFLTCAGFLAPPPLIDLYSLFFVAVNVSFNPVILPWLTCARRG